MNKTSLILKHFQKKDFLNVEKISYAKAVSSLFNWLTENDRVQSDRTAGFIPSKKAATKIISRQEAILAGIEETDYLLKKNTGLAFIPFKKDGGKVKKGEVIAEIKGPVREILSLERTILNILQRFCGIATSTSSLISLISHISPISPINRPPTTDHRPPFIAATRKNPWGLLDKKAVAVGGGVTHRLSLADGILIKDNHLAFIKNTYRLKNDIQATVKALEISLKGTSETRRRRVGCQGDDLDSSEVEESANSFGKLIEIEVETEEQTYAAIETFQKLGGKNHLAILFDNFSPNRISSLLHQLSSLGGLSSVIFEASGGITKENILSFGKTGVDIISLGSLTHSCRAADLSLEI